MVCAFIASWVFSACAEVVPLSLTIVLTQCGILRVRGGSSPGGAMLGSAGRILRVRGGSSRSNKCSMM